jgi:hypothetical protein
MPLYVDTTKEESLREAAEKDGSVLAVAAKRAATLLNTTRPGSVLARPDCAHR